jgi:hypothetical protein
VRVPRLQELAHVAITAHQVASLEQQVVKIEQPSLPL